jgi:hypothetical protein
MFINIKLINTKEMNYKIKSQNRNVKEFFRLINNINEINDYEEQSDYKI